MNSTTKLIVGLVAGLTLVCLCIAAGGFFLVRGTGWVLGNALDSDPAKVAEVSGSIADYTLPAGFGQAFTTDIAGFTMVSYTGDDNHSHIFFFQLPAAIRLDQAEIERQLREATKSNVERPDRMEVVDRIPAKICGQDTTLVVSEGVNHDGHPYRDVTGMFEGRGGQAIVVVSGPVATWNQAVVDEFIASIH